MEKACRICGKVKPLDAFRKNKECRDGHEGTCIDCRKNRKNHTKEKVKPVNKPSKRTLMDAEILESVDHGKKTAACTDNGIGHDVTNYDITMIPCDFEEELTFSDIVGDPMDVPSECRNEPEGFGRVDPERLRKAIEEQGIRIKDIMLDGRQTNVTPDKTILLDFCNYPNLLEAIKKISADEFRTPEQQILYCIHTKLERDGDSRYNPYEN